MCVPSCSLSLSLSSLVQLDKKLMGKRMFGDSDKMTTGTSAYLLGSPKGACLPVRARVCSCLLAPLWAAAPGFAVRVDGQLLLSC